jgi:hypothetical protein
LPNPPPRRRAWQGSRPAYLKILSLMKLHLPRRGKILVAPDIIRGMIETMIDRNPVGPPVPVRTGVQHRMKQVKEEFESGIFENAE